MHGGFEPMAGVTRDIPFIARRSVRDPGETRRVLGVSDGRPLVLASFGGYGLQLPYDVIAQSGLTVIAPALEALHDFLYEDLVAAADVVVSKPGYGIIPEFVANDTALLCVARHFVQYEVLTAAMWPWLRCASFRRICWVDGRSTWRSCCSSASAERPRVDGAG